MVEIILLGESGESGNYYLNLGKELFQDFVIGMAEGIREIEHIEIYAENCSVAFDPVGSKAIKSLAINSTGPINYNGGANIGTITIRAPEVNFNCDCGSIGVVNIEPYNICDYQAVRELLPGICITPGTGDGVFTPASLFTENIFTALKEKLPSVHWVAPVITWVASSTKIADCIIYPGIEKASQASLWKVESPVISYKAKPKLISTFTGTSVPNFGRSFSDEEVFRVFSESKSAGYKTCFMPSLLVDQPGKPWRGFITGEFFEIEKFMKEQYFPYILHYAELLKDKVDAFIIGSELEGITSVHSHDHDFPAAALLCELAEKVKCILGTGVKVSYAANWSEYHHFTGGYRPLDKLWAHPAIDMVGINAYFPITDKKTSNISLEDIKSGWFRGEGYDYYYSGTEKHLLAEDWAWKNFEYWWKNTHYSAGKETAWIPCMKPIWFTETGCASIDKASNQPHIYYSSGSSDSSIPRYSTGHVSRDHMFKYLRGSLEVLKEASFFIENVLAWSWDARGSGWHISGLWGDAKSWAFSHSLEGKLPLLEKNVVIQGKLEADSLNVQALVITINPTNIKLRKFSSEGGALTLNPTGIFAVG